MPDTSAIPTSLPVEFHKFFWDVDAAKVDPQQSPYYVINRLLDKGDLLAARWVLRAFPRELILNTLRTMRDFSPWNGIFWANFLDIPKEEVKCLDQSYLKLRKTHWSF